MSQDCLDVLINGRYKVLGFVRATTWNNIIIIPTVFSYSNAYEEYAGLVANIFEKIREELAGFQDKYDWLPAVYKETREWNVDKLGEVLGSDADTCAVSRLCTAQCCNSCPQLRTRAWGCALPVHAKKY